MRKILGFLIHLVDNTSPIVCIYFLLYSMNNSYTLGHACWQRQGGDFSRSGRTLFWNRPIEWSKHAFSAWLYSQKSERGAHIGFFTFWAFSRKVRGFDHSRTACLSLFMLPSCSVQPWTAHHASYIETGVYLCSEFWISSQIHLMWSSFISVAIIKHPDHKGRWGLNQIIT